MKNIQTDILNILLQKKHAEDKVLEIFDSAQKTREKQIQNFIDTHAPRYEDRKDSNK